MAYERKPLKGKAWKMDQDRREQEENRLMTHQWYRDLDPKRKAQLIPVWSGNLAIDTPNGEKLDFIIKVTQEINQSGNPQLGFDLWLPPAANESPAETAPKPASDPFGEDPFAI
jgi:hypothetical protein